jgi:CRP-like cAMP-binding protein
LRPHDFFGEISMMALNPATATVVARTPVRAYVMSHLQFLEVRVHQSVMLQLKWAMGDRLSADRRPVTSHKAAD